MTRPYLEDLPEFGLPAGFSFRWYQPGDEAHWVRIQLAADRFEEINLGLFQRQFATSAGPQPPSAAAHADGTRLNSDLLRERQCFVLDAGGKAIGTGTAWFGGPLAQAVGNDHPRLAPARSPMHGESERNFTGGRWGRVHWMAMLPEFQGRGLGKALMTTICRRLRDLGHERAYLHTSAARRPAIRLYLNFGFEPIIRKAEEKSAWQEILGEPI